MSNKKSIGSFYTPKVIADFLVDYLSKKIIGKDMSILEPSAGDGIFVKSLLAHKTLSKKIYKIIAVEREENELAKINAITKNKILKSHHADFLDFQKENKEQFSLVIGNPPYFKKNLLSKVQQELSLQIFKDAGLNYKSAKNIWAAFFVRSISFVNENGLLAMVLPSDFKQVSFAKDLRELLKNKFERVFILDV